MCVYISSELRISNVLLVKIHYYIASHWDPSAILLLGFLLMGCFLLIKCRVFVPFSCDQV